MLKQRPKTLPTEGSKYLVEKKYVDDAPSQPVLSLDTRSVTSSGNVDLVVDFHLMRRLEALKVMKALREEAIAEGMKLLDEDELAIEVAKYKGESED